MNADLLNENPGAWLRARRKSRRLSQRVAAELAGYSHVSLHLVETGDRRISALAAANIAQALGCTPSEVRAVREAMTRYLARVRGAGSTLPTLDDVSELPSDEGGLP